MNCLRQANMKYKLILFDLDGTLLDTSPGIFNSVRFALKESGLPQLPDNQLSDFVGPPPIYVQVYDACISHAYNLCSSDTVDFIQDWNNVCMDTYSYWFSGIFWWADSCGYCSKEDEVCRIYSLSGEICEILIYGGVNRS